MSDKNIHNLIMELQERKITDSEIVKILLAVVDNKRKKTKKRLSK